MEGEIRVLYVSGDQDSIKQVVESLEDYGMRVRTETSPEDALQHVNDIDCVVSSYELPGGDALDFLAETTKHAGGDGFSRPPFILFTERERGDLAGDALAAGVTDYVHRDGGAEQYAVLANRIKNVVPLHRGESEMERRFRILIEGSSDIITLLDESGTIIYNSPSLERIMGYESKEWIGQHGFDMVHPDDREHAFEEFLRLVQDPDYTPSIEARFEHKNGSWRWLEVRGRNLIDDPAVGGIVANTRDITERKEHQQRLEVLNRVLRHDLRNDMNIVLGNAEMLMDRVKGEKESEILDEIRDTTFRMVELSKKARDIEEIMSRDGTVQKKKDIVEVVRNCVESVQENYPGVRMDADLPESAEVYAIENIDTAIDNVIENAIEHNDTESPRVGVEISNRAGDQSVEIAIKDNGSGIPQEERQVLLEGKETQLRHTSGLGLWLVNWIVGKSDGEVVFESDDASNAVKIRLQKA